ncbi:MAG: hypothetical protein ACYCVN_06825 [Acidimicrobiales bacterium]
MVRSDGRPRRHQAVYNRFTGRFRSGAMAGTDVPVSRLWEGVGHVAVNWSSLEIRSGFVLMELVGENDESLAQAVVAGQRVENVWDTTEALLVARMGDEDRLVRAFRAWRQRAKSLRRRRNEAIHSGWTFTDGHGGLAATDLMSTRAKRGAREDLFPGGVSQLEALAHDIGDLEDELEVLRSRLPGATPAGS